MAQKNNISITKRTALKLINLEGSYAVFNYRIESEWGSGNQRGPNPQH